VRALSEHLTRRSMTIDELNARRARAARPFYTATDVEALSFGQCPLNGHDPDEIVIPPHQIYGCLTQAADLARPATRVASRDQIRTMLTVEQPIYTGKSAPDGVWERFAVVTGRTGARLSNQRALRRSWYIGSFAGELAVAFDRTVADPQKVEDFIAYAGRDIGIGASGKMGWGRFELKSPPPGCSPSPPAKLDPRAGNADFIDANVPACATAPSATPPSPSPTQRLRSFRFSEPLLVALHSASPCRMLRSCPALPLPTVANKRSSYDERSARCSRAAKIAAQAVNAKPVFVEDEDGHRSRQWKYEELAYFTQADIAQALRRCQVVEIEDLLETISPTAIRFAATKGWLFADGPFLRVTLKAAKELDLPRTVNGRKIRFYNGPLPEKAPPVKIPESAGLWWSSGTARVAPVSLITN
jgi:hypothetical protein